MPFTDKTALNDDQRAYIDSVVKKERYLNLGIICVSSIAASYLLSWWKKR